MGIPLLLLQPISPTPTEPSARLTPEPRGLDVVMALICNISTKCSRDARIFPQPDWLNHFKLLCYKQLGYRCEKCHIALRNCTAISNRPLLTARERTTSQKWDWPGEPFACTSNRQVCPTASA